MNEAEKDFRQILNNILFGRWCMNVEYFCQTKFIQDW